MTIWFGRVGALTAFPSIGRSISAPLSVPSAVHQIAGRGGRVVDRFPGAAARVYGMARSWLTADELSIFEAYYLGAYGPGPFVLIEPWRRNMLSANQSSGTDVLADTTGFVALTGAITSSTAQADNGVRSLAWAVTAANQSIITGNIAGTATADVAFDVPVLPLATYTGQYRGRLSTSTGTVRIDILWYDAAGTFISTSTGTPAALSTSAFTTIAVNGTAPSNAALARLRAQNTVMGAAQTIYLDKWQFEMPSAFSPWVMGTGVPRVSFTDDLAQTYNLYPYADAGFTLTEVGAS